MAMRKSANWSGLSATSSHDFSQGSAGFAPLDHGVATHLRPVSTSHVLVVLMAVIRGFAKVAPFPFIMA